MSAMVQRVEIASPAIRPRAPKVLTRRMALEIVGNFLAELECKSLEVILIPSQDPDCAMRGGMIRAVQFANPEWYQEFCGLYETTGKKKWRRRKHFQTKIKRQHTRRALMELLTGQCETIYAQRLRDFIRSEWERFI